MGFPRWIRASTGSEAAQKRCYTDLLNEMIEYANTRTARCAVCPLSTGCRVWEHPDC